MSSKRAYYFHKRFNWREITNLFAYEVKMPERLSKRQQILRLYKSCQRRIFEMELHGGKSAKLHAYSEQLRQLKEDFLKLKSAQSEKEIDSVLEKYEYFMELNFNMNPWTHDNVAYEWRHAKGLLIESRVQIETDHFGYYDRAQENYYPATREWQFRDEFPMEDFIYEPEFSSNWQNVDENDTSMHFGNAKSPEEFAKEIAELKEKHKIESPNMWDNAKH